MGTASGEAQTPRRFIGLFSKSAKLDPSTSISTTAPTSESDGDDGDPDRFHYPGMPREPRPIAMRDPYPGGKLEGSKAAEDQPLAPLQHDGSTTIVYIKAGSEHRALLYLMQKVNRLYALDDVLPDVPPEIAAYHYNILAAPKNAPLDGDAATSFHTSTLFSLSGLVLRRVNVAVGDPLGGGRVDSTVLQRKLPVQRLAQQLEKQSTPRSPTTPTTPAASASAPGASSSSGGGAGGSSVPSPASHSAVRGGGGGSKPAPLGPRRGGGWGGSRLRAEGSVVAGGGSGGGLPDKDYLGRPIKRKMPEGGGRRRRRLPELVPVAMYSHPRYLETAADIIRAFNRTGLIVTPYLYATVVAASAVGTIQGWWRSHMVRRATNYPELIRKSRAARIIQRAWRAYLLRARLDMLAAIRRTVTSISGLLLGANLALTAAHCAVLRDRSARPHPAPLFPEQRLRFGFDRAGGALLVEGERHLPRPPKEGTWSPGLPTPPAPRSLPEWCGLQLPLCGERAAVSLHGCREVMGQANVLTLLTRDTLWQDNMGNELSRASLPDIYPTDAAATAAALAGGGSAGDVVLAIVSFSSVHEAAVRAAMIAAYTWDPMRRTGVLLLPLHQTAAARGAQTQAALADAIASIAANTGGPAAAAAAAAAASGARTSPHSAANTAAPSRAASPSQPPSGVPGAVASYPSAASAAVAAAAGSLTWRHTPLGSRSRSRNSLMCLPPASPSPARSPSISPNRRAVSPLRASGGPPLSPQTRGSLASPQRRGGPIPASPQLSPQRLSRSMVVPPIGGSAAASPQTSPSRARGQQLPALPYRPGTVPTANPQPMELDPHALRTSTTGLAPAAGTATAASPSVSTSGGPLTASTSTGQLGLTHGSRYSSPQHSRSAAVPSMPSSISGGQQQQQGPGVLQTQGSLGSAGLRGSVTAVGSLPGEPSRGSITALGHSASSVGRSPGGLYDTPPGAPQPVDNVPLSSLARALSPPGGHRSPRATAPLDSSHVMPAPPPLHLDGDAGDLAAAATAAAAAAASSRQPSMTRGSIAIPTTLYQQTSPPHSPRSSRLGSPSHSPRGTSPPRSPGLTSPPRSSRLGSPSNSPRLGSPRNNSPRAGSPSRDALATADGAPTPVSAAASAAATPRSPYGPYDTLTPSASPAGRPATVQVHDGLTDPASGPGAARSYLDSSPGRRRQPADGRGDSGDGATDGEYGSEPPSSEGADYYRGATWRAPATAQSEAQSQPTSPYVSPGTADPDSSLPPSPSRGSPPDPATTSTAFPPLQGSLPLPPLPPDAAEGPSADPYPHMTVLERHQAAGLYADMVLLPVPRGRGGLAAGGGMYDMATVVPRYGSLDGSYGAEVLQVHPPHPDSFTYADTDPTSAAGGAWGHPDAAAAAGSDGGGGVSGPVGDPCAANPELQVTPAAIEVLHMAEVVAEVAEALGNQGRDDRYFLDNTARINKLVYTEERFARHRQLMSKLMLTQVIGRQTAVGHVQAPNYSPLSSRAMGQIVTEMRRVYTGEAAELVAAMRENHREAMVIVQDELNSTARLIAATSSLQAAVVDSELARAERERSRALKARVTRAAIRALRRERAAQDRAFAAAFGRQVAGAGKQILRSEIRARDAVLAAEAAAHGAVRRQVDQTIKDHIALAEEELAEANRAKAGAVRAEGWTEEVAQHYALLDQWQSDLVALRRDENYARMRRVGPAGGVWGSGRPRELLRAPLPLTSVVSAAAAAARAERAERNVVSASAADGGRRRAGGMAGGGGGGGGSTAGASSSAAAAPPTSGVNLESSSWRSLSVGGTTHTAVGGAEESAGEDGAGGSGSDEGGAFAFPTSTGGRSSFSSAWPLFDGDNGSMATSSAPPSALPSRRVLPQPQPLPEGYVPGGAGAGVAGGAGAAAGGPPPLVEDVSEAVSEGPQLRPGGGDGAGKGVAQKEKGREREKEQGKKPGKGQVKGKEGKGQRASSTSLSSTAPSVSVASASPVPGTREGGGKGPAGSSRQSSRGRQAEVSKSSTPRSQLEDYLPEFQAVRPFGSRQGQANGPVRPVGIVVSRY